MTSKEKRHEVMKGLPKSNKVATSYGVYSKTFPNQPILPLPRKEQITQLKSNIKKNNNKSL